MPLSYFFMKIWRHSCKCNLSLNNNIWPLLPVSLTLNKKIIFGYYWPVLALCFQGACSFHVIQMHISFLSSISIEKLQQSLDPSGISQAKMRLQLNGEHHHNDIILTKAGNNYQSAPAHYHTWANFGQVMSRPIQHSRNIVTRQNWIEGRFPMYSLWGRAHASLSDFQTRGI